MPRLDDPKEFALIRRIYFNNDEPVNDDLDPEERWDRIRSRRTINQAR
jgi:hypothetical protein